MQRATILDTLVAHRPWVSTRFGFTRLGIFGSVARDQATEASDVDVIVEMPPTFFNWLV